MNILQKNCLKLAQKRYKKQKYNKIIDGVILFYIVNFDVLLNKIKGRC